jgi:multimeric flavodoxin WrbA
VKVVALSGSARKGGNTALLARTALAELEAAGVETELIEMAGIAVRGCTACGTCGKTKDGRCAVVTDPVNEWIAKMIEADGIILASPTYFADVSSETKALIDRAGMVTRSSGSLLRRKVGAAIVAVRRAGAIHALDTMNHFFLIGEMIVVGSSYWNVGIGRTPGEVAGDDEGMATMRDLGRNMAWALERLAPQQRTGPESGPTNFGLGE